MDHVNNNSMAQEYYCSSLVQIPVWMATIEFVCHCFVFPHLAADNEDRVCARVHHLKASHKQTDWSDEYKRDSNTNLM